MLNNAYKLGIVFCCKHWLNKCVDEGCYIGIATTSNACGVLEIKVISEPTPI
jgi:hypothetical protein